MRLVDLEPRWWRTCDGRSGQGISFNCPCCGNERLAIAFANPLDGLPVALTPGLKAWTRVGETFETLSVSPSIDASASNHWHGFIINGQIT